jgi:hypothetical protein
MPTDSNAFLPIDAERKPFSVGLLLRRSAAVFGWGGAVGFALSAILLRYHPLESANPYYFGMICGGMTAANAAFYTMFESFVPRATLLDFLYFGLLMLWSFAVWLWLSVAPEGLGLGPYAAAGSMVLGTITWPLCRFRIPRTFAILTTGFGVVMVATYLVLSTQFGIR